MSSHNQQHKACFKNIIVEKWDSLGDVSVAGSHVLEGTGGLKRSSQPSERCNVINLVCCYVWSTPLCKQVQVESILKIITDKTSFFHVSKLCLQMASVSLVHVTRLVFQGLSSQGHPCSATFHLCVLGVPGNGRAVPATDAPAASAAVQLHGVLAPSPLLCCPPTWPSTGKHKGKGTSKQAPAGNCRRRHSAFDGAKHHFPQKNC